MFSVGSWNGGSGRQCLWWPIARVPTDSGRRRRCRLPPAFGQFVAGVSALFALSPSDPFAPSDSAAPPPGRLGLCRSALIGPGENSGRHRRPISLHFLASSGSLQPPLVRLFAHLLLRLQFAFVHCRVPGRLSPGMRPIHRQQQYHHRQRAGQLRMLLLVRLIHHDRHQRSGLQ